MQMTASGVFYVHPDTQTVEMRYTSAHRVLSMGQFVTILHLE